MRTMKEFKRKKYKIKNKKGKKSNRKLYVSYLDFKHLKNGTNDSAIMEVILNEKK